jgi:hypothetical protein
MALALLILTLGPVSWLIAGTSVMRLHGVDQADAINAVRQTVLTGLAGAAALVALGFTVRTYYLSRHGQVTDRFGKAISQLASNKLEERLGGIHALGTSWLNRRRTIRRWLASCYAVVAEDLAEAAATAIATSRARPGRRPRDDLSCHICASTVRFDLENGSRDSQPIPRSGGVSAGSGGGRESNPPATRSAARRF